MGNKDFKQWRDGSQDRLLWIRGDPGKGKTMLLCGIINELERQPASGNTSYFFCQATDSRINTAAAVLRGLIYLLVEQQPLLISHIRKKYDKAGKSLFEDANAWVALSQIFKDDILRDPRLRKTHLIIDALDECLMEGLPDLLSLIIQISEENPDIKWIISSRNELSIEEKLGNSTESISLCLELNDDSISAAVRGYIRHKTDQLAKQKKYDENLKIHVERYLTDHADGTFLWVSLACQELALPGVRKRHMRNKLQTFPSGLVPLYGRMMQQIRSSEDMNLCIQILAVLLLTFRPITLTELRPLLEAAEFDDDPETLKEIIQLCGSFLYLRDGTIFFIHQSAKDFLLEQECEVIFPSGIEIKHLAIFRRSINAMSRILRRDIYNLQHPGISLYHIKPPSPDPLAPIRYACTYWGGHFEQAGSVRDDIALGDFLKVHLLHWFEALGLLEHVWLGVYVLERFVVLLKVNCAFLKCEGKVWANDLSLENGTQVPTSPDMSQYVSMGSIS